MADSDPTLIPHRDRRPGAALRPQPRDGHELPLAAAELERLRFRARREMPSAGLAGMRRRRVGQSLEYRDHRAYVAGDDVRLIDWRASERLSGDGDLVVRNFEAEERFTIAVAVDNRPDMSLPEAAPAALVSRWIVEAIAVIAAREKLAVRFLPLFTGPPQPSRPAAGAQVTAAARAFCDGLAGGADDEPGLATAAVMRALPPACAVIVVTTATFADPLGRFAALLAGARRGFRQLAVAVLDPWPYERALLAQGSVALDASAGAAARRGVFDPSPAELDASAAALDRHRREVLASAAPAVQYPLRWPAAAGSPLPALRDTFRRWFMDFAVTTQLFAREAR